MLPSFRHLASRLSSGLALVMMCVVCGCTQYYNIVQPPPAMFPRGWNSSGSMALAGMPTAAGLQAGAGFTVNQRTVINLGFNTTLLPTSIGVTYYHPIGRDVYISAQLHLSDLWFLKLAPFTPTVEIDLGLHTAPCPFYSSVNVGMAYFPDVHDGWWSRLNVLSGSGGASLVPCVGVTTFLGPAVVGVAWYPGRTRHFLEQYSYGLLADGDSIVYGPPEIESVIYFDSASESFRYTHPELQQGDLYVHLRDGDEVHIQQRAERHSWFVQAAEGVASAALPKIPRDTTSAVSYYWVSLYKGNTASSRLIHQQVMALDPVAIFEGYRQTGGVVIRNDLTTMRRLRSYSVPIQSDLSLAYGIWWHDIF